MDEHNDIELVELAKGGHTHALQQLIERHYLTVYRLAYKWLSLAAAAAPVRLREPYLRLRNAVAIKMSFEQVLEGQRLAMEWHQGRSGRTGLAASAPGL